MEAEDELRLLEDAKGDPVALAFATVALTYPDLTPSQLAELTAGLQAAAIPHWFSAEMLAELVSTTNDEAEVLYEHLRLLTLTEPFRARGSDASNVHEATRLAIRRQLAEAEPDRFRLLGSTIAAQLQVGRTSDIRIERVYHLLTAEPDRGADELANLSQELEDEAGHAEMYALSAALRELETEEMLEGRPRVRALLTIARHRASLDGAAGLAETAGSLLAESIKSGNDRLREDVLGLVGWAAEERGDIGSARTAYEEQLELSRSRWTQVPGDTSRQRSLAAAYQNLGDVDAQVRDFEAAHDSYEKSLTINEQLSAADPKRTGLRRSLAVAHNRMGLLALERGDLPGAAASFDRYLAILAELTRLDPANSNWQREYAVAYSNVGDVAMEDGRLDDALDAFRESLAISIHLARLDPTNRMWQRDLARAHNQVGLLAQKHDDIETARSSYGEFLDSLRRLSELEPSNVEWRRDLGIALFNLGDVSEASGDLDAALAHFEEACSIFDGLAGRDSTNVTVQEDLANARERVRNLQPHSWRRIRARLVAWTKRLGRDDPHRDTARS